MAKVFCTKCLVSHEFQANLASHISPELLQARVRAEAPEASEDENEHVQGNVSESEDTSDISISTFNSADEAALQELERNERGGGTRGIWGKHGERHRQAILPTLPYLKQQLRLPESPGNTERANVQAAIQLAQDAGVENCWGNNKVYKSKRNFENAIINLYYPSISAAVRDE